MTMETIRDIFLWSAAINLGILLWWFAIFSLTHDWVYRLHAKWFRMPVEQFDVVHYAGMAVYKIGILLFFLVPYIALRMAS